MKKILKFPKGFLWGSAVSSYQVEGGIENSDWSSEFPAGKACDYYNQYEKYFDLARELNQNVHRLSLEWSRIQPSEDKFDRQAIEHYRKILMALRARNIKTVVTIWHWTLPIWVSEMGGWHNKKTVEYFQQYAEFVAEELDDLVDFWVTINEPMVYITLAYFLGIFPPHKKNEILIMMIVFKNLINGHKKAYTALHDNNKNAKVGIADNCAYADAFDNNSILDRTGAKIWRYLRVHLFYDFIRKYQDYIGINYYFHDKIKFTPFKYPFLRRGNDNKLVTDVGWEIYPEGIYHVLIQLKKYYLPIYITENGLADAKDERREKFIVDHLYWMHKAITEGADVRGYMHWSLVDNFEWTFAFKPRFGLLEMNYETITPKIRPSALIYAGICKTNELKID
ncbi:MAG: glycoside hydrolase family 1 protein [Minisyncoccia bacterium]